MGSLICLSTSLTDMLGWLSGGSRTFSLVEIPIFMHSTYFLAAISRLFSDGISRSPVKDAIPAYKDITVQALLHGSVAG